MVFGDADEPLGSGVLGTFQKQTKTAAEIKELIWAELHAKHPECESAELVVIPAVGQECWTVSIGGDGPTVDTDCLRKIQEIAVKLSDSFDVC
jgi:hypothetical protein